MKDIFWSSVPANPIAGLIYVSEGIGLSLEAEIGQYCVFLKAGLTRSKPLFVHLYMDLLYFPMVQAYSHSEGSQRAISTCSDIFTLCLKEECNVLFT